MGICSCEAQEKSTPKTIITEPMSLMEAADRTTFDTKGKDCDSLDQEVAATSSGPVVEPEKVKQVALSADETIKL